MTAKERNARADTDGGCRSAHGAAGFATINRAFNTVFQPGRLSLGLVVPIESYAIGAKPPMTGLVERVQLAERLGFSAVWLRDVPFDVPSFGDVGQIFDPFVTLGLLAGRTEQIALGVASIILPLRHPAHVAKAASSVDALSGGRLLLGVASGDRPEEYPALGVSYPDRGARFRHSMAYIRAMAEDWPSLANGHGCLDGGIDLQPKPMGGRLPLLITGGSQQEPDWVAAHGDGWMTYPREPSLQRRIVSAYQQRVALSGGTAKPVMQSLYIDLVEEDAAPATAIHLGFRSGLDALAAHLDALEAAGVHHVALNLRFNQADIAQTLQRLADRFFPRFARTDPEHDANLSSLPLM